MSLEQKVVFTKRVATFQAELTWELSGRGKPESIFRGIGTLDLRKVDQVDQGHDAEDLDKVSPGLLVSHEFFMGDHLYYDIPRGPFRSSHDWLSAVLNIIIVHQTAVLEKTDDEDEKEDAEEILPVAQRLLALVPKVFPAHPDEAETTALLPPRPPSKQHLGE
ncbi:LOW QUALITY PROTEIN: hypothetical protein QC762_0078110 [Podospora pseudocomata]|uniref:Uncharacterized protein n=1 Tax=Podospora pseudocomata TaxID=2093779 RepID=A0ABR0GAZ0_9PEZI|nr:LOW QUALITY PROTEIN: hypothetical protein QC762_0078110 [Podospora pseudocomata]